MSSHVGSYRRSPVTVNETDYYRMWDNVTTANGHPRNKTYAQTGSVEHVLDQYLIPGLCVLGFVGNVINLLVLSRSRYRQNVALVEMGATPGLVVLALSDLLFCVAMFPRAFVPSTHSLFTSRDFRLYYQTLGTGLVTTFILTSTWITVSMATLRYLVICHPLRSRNCVGLTSYTTLYGLPVLLCVLFNLPSFWQYRVREIGGANSTFYLVDIGYMEYGTARGVAFQWTKSVFGLFLPALILVYCNFSLIVALRRSYRMRKKCHVRQTGSSARNLVTLTLVTIVTSFILLVFPSELMDFFLECVNTDATRTELFLRVRAIANTLQVLNFACNFFLYCSVNSQFRLAMREQANMDCLTCSSQSPTPSNRVRLRVTSSMHCRHARPVSSTTVTVSRVTSPMTSP